MKSGEQALERLKAGNQRFVDSLSGPDVRIHRMLPASLPQEQTPFAVILGCSDARVPAELVFDQSFGDLFVIRVAGNVVAPSQVGSVEFAAVRFGVKLVVVLGHSRCGAITATLEELLAPGSTPSRNLASIVDRVRPSVCGLLQTELRHDHDALVHHAVRANVRMSVDHLCHGSRLLEQMIYQDGLKIVGAEYSLETGRVEFFDERFF